MAKTLDNRTKLIARLREVRPQHLGVMLTPVDVAIVLAAMRVGALPPVPKHVTARQLDVLRAFASIVERDGINPTMQQVADMLGVSRVTVHEKFRSLVDKGCLTRTGYGTTGCYSLAVSVPPLAGLDIWAGRLTREGT